MRDARIIEGEPFDWKAAEEAHAVLAAAIDAGCISYGAAMAADPGVMRCPMCRAWYWRQGDVVECVDCGCQWTTARPVRVLRIGRWL